MFNAFLYSDETIVRIEQSKIDSYKQQIAQELRNNSIIKTGMVAAGLLSIGYYGYKIFFEAPKIVENLSPVLSSKINMDDQYSFVIKQAEIIQAQQKSLQDRDKAFEVIRERLADYGEDVGLPMKRSGYLKGWGRFLGNQCLLIAVSQIVTSAMNPFGKYFKIFDTTVDRFMAKFFHNRDLNWFLTNKVNINDLSNELENYATQMSKTNETINNINNPALVNGEKKEYNRVLFISTWELYIQQLSATLGFMYYKVELIKKTSPVNAIRLQKMAEKLIQEINNSATWLDNIINSFSQIANPTFPAHIKELQTNVQQSLQEFIFAEALINY